VVLPIVLAKQAEHKRIVEGIMHIMHRVHRNLVTLAAAEVDKPT
jgi:hypothetical protein